MSRQRDEDQRPYFEAPILKIGGRVKHAYDHSSRGTVRRMTDFIYIQWDGDTKLNPCTIDELKPAEENVQRAV